MIPLTLLSLALAASPFHREQPDVAAGNERLLQGDPAGALARYDEAERAVGTRPELDYDRGTALVRQGKTAEGLDALRRAAERGDAPLASRALQNAGGALDAAGDRDGAIRAYADALARDPGNDDARFNLEVLLRRRAQEKKGGGAKEEPERRPPQQGKPDADQGKGGGAERADPRRGGERAGAQGREPREEPRRGEAGRAAGEPTSRQDAERLLDALRARERNLPPGTWQRKETRRRDVEKDW